MIIAIFLMFNPASGGLAEGTAEAGGSRNPHPRNFSQKHFLCPKIGMLMPKGISNYAKFVLWNYFIYPVRGGSVNMTISDMSQNLGQKYYLNLHLPSEFVLLEDMLPMGTSLGHMWTTGENCIFLSVTVFAQLKFKVGHLQANFRIFAQKSSKKRWNFAT